jgi:16S rRNA (guanine1207-N2)-methyltransferase
MRAQRLQRACDDGFLWLPADGCVAVLRPEAGDDLSGLPRDRVTVVTGFRPDFDHFAAAAWRTATEVPAGCGAALVCVPRSRALARALVAAADAAVVPGGPVAVDGQKTDGIDSLLDDLRGRGVPLGDALAKAHGRLAVFPAGQGLADWMAQDSVMADGLVTRPGVFSAEGADAGSALLAAALPARLPGVLADLGAGWGYLSVAALRRDGVTAIDLIEAEAEALACARRNVTDPRARFHWVDATRFAPGRRYDGVVCNPPFHRGRRTDPGLGAAFIAAAARMLLPSGVLWVVANRHLPYERVFADLFHDVSEIGGDRAFRLYRAARPIASRP